MPVPKEIFRLVERFQEHLESYKSGHYNETQLRREFLDPFFKALGWDVDNERNYAEAYKDVIHEDAIRIGGAVKAPDYCFRIGGTRKFFLEAKKPSIAIKEETNSAFQLRRYAWSAKLPLSILSDFDEFAVYDCRIKPIKTDSASTARIFFCDFREFAEKWDWIYSVFSREAVLKGSFDKFAETNKAKRGTTQVDDDFLATIEHWRSVLARNIALRNEDLTQRELNFSVQRIIDRIIFLRICEDRGIELYGRLLALTNGSDLYSRLVEIFEEADAKYNSGLFHFKQEKDRQEPPDELTVRLKIDDKLLKDLFKGLYYPESPYEFTVLSSDILGQVYEQFLGKIIRLTDGHRAVIDDKPEVKKAGGVYYTPPYIVDYIVRQTVGELAKGKIPKQAAKLRILDPACGSGSFLINAYQHLLDWHRDWYIANKPETWAKGRNPALVQTTAGWKLTITERKRILLDNIYGVDIDPQAVEVTKLSLLLKVLEGESEQTIQPYLRLFQERALPDLENNIKCGNSLIESDFLGINETPIPTCEELEKVNAFDWKKEYSDVISAGGFDCIIGNPPYGAVVSPIELEYLRRRFHASSNDVDTYALFMEKAVLLCKTTGRIGMIVPTGWYSGSKFSILRRYFAQNTDPVMFVNLPYDVFKAWVDTSIFITQKRSSVTRWPRRDKHIALIKTFPKRHKISSAEEFGFCTKKIVYSDWFDDGDAYLTYADTETTKLMNKIEKLGTPLGKIADIQRGVTPFHLSDTKIHPNSTKAFNGSIFRYVVHAGQPCFLRFDKSLAEYKPKKYFVGPRLLLRELISRKFRLQAAYVEKDFITNKSVQSILNTPNGPDLKYVLGILNSRLMSWFFLNKSNIAQRDDFPKIVLKETRNLPIIIPNEADKSEALLIRKIIGFVERMMEMASGMPPSKGLGSEALSRNISAIDLEIDKVVFQLYRLTPKEIGIIDAIAAD